MTIYRCGHCEYEGPCYGTPTSKGVSAPFCPICQMNSKLEPVTVKKEAPCFSQEEVTKVFHITRMFLAGLRWKDVAERLSMEYSELDALQDKIERWEDANAKD